MSVESVLRRGRKVRQKLMRSRCRIVRPGGREFDPATGTYVDANELVLYTGPCHFKPGDSGGVRTANTADRELVEGQYQVIIPWDNDALEVSISDTVYLTECGDEWAVGRPLRVDSVQYANDRTSRHFIVVDQERGTVEYG